ncbi:MAG TPA: hypothetical protein VFX16_01005 [Pseudonocardiaceae bacterium]|nr:hypothetical protein [Pseudonocardiaceae bacterium]
MPRRRTATNLQAAALPDRIGHQIVRHGVVPAAIERYSVREHRGLRGVVVERVIRVLDLVRPHGHTIIASVPDEIVRYHRIGHTGVEVDAVRDLVDDRVVGDPQVGNVSWTAAPAM